MSARLFSAVTTAAMGVPSRRLKRIERRLRRRQHELDARSLTVWAGIRQALHARGVRLPAPEDGRAR